MADEIRPHARPARSRRRAACAGLAALALTLSGCTTVGPDFTRPESPTTPGGYAMAGESQAAGVRLDPQARIAGPWWRAFGSQALDQTVRLALAENPGVAEARATLERYQAAEQAARGDRLPQAQATTDAQRQKFNSQAFGFPGFPSRTFSLYSLGASVSYDLDVFGGGRRRREEAAAWTERAAHQADAAYLTLSGNVALQAMRIAGLSAQIATVKQIAADDRRLLEMARQAEALGGLAHTEVTQAEARLAEDEAMAAPLQREYDAARHQLALLVGKSPAEWTPPDFDLDHLTVPGDIPVSLPSSLIRLRPDILAAEAGLHAATAAVGVATADQYPDIRLSAKGALSALEPGELFSADSTGWNLFGGVTAPMFDGGARKARTKAAEAEARAALARYRQTVLRAFTQVSDVMAALQTDQQQLEALDRAVSAREREALVTEAAVGLGGASPQRAIEARRELSRQRRALAEGQARLLTDMVELFAASAADWRGPQPPGGADGFASGR